MQNSQPIGVRITHELAAPASVRVISWPSRPAPVLRTGTSLAREHVGHENIGEKLMARHQGEDDERSRFGGQRGSSRRTMLMVVGSGGAAAWAIGNYAGSATAVAPDSVEAAVAEYFTARADAATHRQVAPLNNRIDPANASLANNEAERSGFLSGLGSESRWDGEIQKFSTSPGILWSKASGSSATVRAYEELKIGWRPAPRERTADITKVAEQDPQRYGLDRPEGEPVTSEVGVAHELTLDKGTSGWVVTSDAYVEDLFLGESPDAARSPWARSMGTPRSNSDLRTHGIMPPESPAGTEPVTARTLVAEAAAGARSYSWRKAVSYANTYWSSYNSTYPNYNPCGGDCANFVSQCLRAGGETDDGTWYTRSGVGCQKKSSSTGSTAWVNNQGLRNWTINTSRGRAVSTIGELGRGDIVNYDWTGNGVFDHVAIITNSASMLVTAHNSNRYNVPWSMGAKKHRFTWILGHY